METITSCMLQNNNPKCSVNDFEQGTISQQSNNTPVSSDLYSVGGGFSLLNFTDFETKLSNLTGFDGFSPRLTMLGKLRAMPIGGEIPRNTSCIFLVVVSIKGSK